MARAAAVIMVFLMPQRLRAARVKATLSRRQGSSQRPLTESRRAARRSDQAGSTPGTLRRRSASPVRHAARVLDRATSARSPRRARSEFRAPRARSACDGPVERRRPARRRTGGAARPRPPRAAAPACRPAAARPGRGARPAARATSGGVRLSVASRATAGIRPDDGQHAAAQRRRPARPPPRHQPAEQLGDPDQAPGRAAPARPGRCRAGRRRPRPRQDGGQLPGQLVHVAQPEPQPLPDERRAEVGGVAGQEHPAGPPAVGDLRPERRTRPRARSRRAAGSTGASSAASRSSGVAPRRPPPSRSRNSQR